jgi:FkbM family methyltransferase
MFEPAASNVALLRARHPAEIAIPMGLSDRATSATLYTNADGSGLASLHQRRLDHYDISHEAGELVSTTTLDDYCSENSLAVDVLKLDIEGHELAALKGALRTLPEIRAVQFEFGGCNIDSRCFFQDFWYLFTAAGFELYRITPFGPRKLDRYRETDEQFTIANYVAVNQR